MPSDLPANLSHRELVVELANRNQLPVIYPFREFVEISGFIAYGFDVADIWRHSAYEIDQILRGRKPSELRYYQLTKLALIINLKTAKVLGLTLPLELLARPDEGIE